MFFPNLQKQKLIPPQEAGEDRAETLGEDSPSPRSCFPRSVRHLIYAPVSGLEPHDGPQQTRGQKSPGTEDGILDFSSLAALPLCQSV